MLDLPEFSEEAKNQETAPVAEAGPSMLSKIWEIIKYSIIFHGELHLILHADHATFCSRMRTVERTIYIPETRKQVIQIDDEGEESIHWEPIDC